LDVKRYAAIDGRRVNDKIIEQVLGHPKSQHFKRSILQNNRQHIGHFGCFLSHIGVYQEFMKSDKPYCLIFEDDAEFKTESFKEDMNRHMGNVPDDWSIVLFGFHTADDLHDKKNQKTFLQNDIFHKLEHWTGMQAYLLNKKSCAQLLEKLVNPQWYLDWAISDMTAAGTFNVYAVFKPIVCQPACYTVKFDNPQLQMHYIQDCKHGGGMTTTFSE
jgi:GR25 family glycosyltransferase involved in LPS biosynthesis